MDADIVIFWLVCFSCLTGLVMALRHARAAGRGWTAVFLAILLVCLAGRFWRQPALIYVAGALWLVLVLLPGLLSRLYFRCFVQQRYGAARWLARIIVWLHPADGWRQHPQILRALELAQRGDMPAALENLQRLREAKSLVGFAAVANLYRLTNQWTELLAWEAQHRLVLAKLPQLLHLWLRARGETGDLHGLVALYARNQSQIAKLNPPASRDLCRLMLFAFCGRRALAERLFAGSLAIVPALTREFWLATADLAAGQPEAARRRLELLLPGADPPMRLAIERRLTDFPPRAEPLDPAAETLLEAVALEHGQEESFEGRRTLFSKAARATQALIVLNVLMFAVELGLGGGTNMDTLYRLGALFPPAVRAGEWWRLGASVFLHFGALHLILNMAGLWLLGPFAEFAVGSRRFLLIYLIAGIGSMGAVMGFARGPQADQLAVGASGCIMGLVGATGALMLRAWWREKAPIAKQRLIAVLTIVVTQTAFDAMVPQVSMTAHLSGTLIGFVTTLLLRDRLRGAARVYTPTE